MARPRLELGTWGQITTIGQVCRDGKWVAKEGSEKAERYRARTRLRDLDGVVREVVKFAPTKARAEARLKAALRDRTTPRQGDMLRADMAVEKAGEMWLEQVSRPGSGRSTETIFQYRQGFSRYVAGSSVASLTLREVNSVPIIRSYLQEVADARGTGSAKTAKSILSGILTMSVNDGVLDINAARQTRPVKATEARTSDRDHTRALTREERDQLLAFVAADKKSKERDVVDMLHWMAGMGVRISEALGQRWDDTDLADAQAIIRGTKSEASADRVVAMPGWLVERLRTRKEIYGVPTSGLVFASIKTGRRRDRRNAGRQVRDVLDRAGFDWVIPHTFRRTVATYIDQAGLGAALAADVLGHADASMTARVYFGRRGDTSKAAEIL